MSCTKDDQGATSCCCDCNDKIAKLRDSYDRQKKDLQQAAIFGKTLLEENSQLKYDLQKAAQKFDTFIQEKHELEVKLELNAKSQTSVVQENEVLRETVQELEKALDLLQVADTEKSRREATLSFQVEQLKNELTLEKERFLSKCDELDSAVRDFNSNCRVVREEIDCGHGIEISQLKKKLEEVEETNKTLENELAEAKQKVNALQCTEMELRGLVMELKAQVDQFERQITTMSNLLEEKRMENLELQGQLEAERVSCVDIDKRGNSLFGEIEDRRQQAERQLAKLKVLYDTLVKKNQSLQGQNVNLRNEVTLLSFGSSSRDRSEYVSQLNCLISDQKTQNERLLRTVSQLQEELRENGKKLPPMSAIQGVWLKDLMEEHKAEVKKLQERLRDEITGRICSTERTQGILKRLDETEGQLQQARGEIARQKMQIESLLRDKQPFAEEDKIRPLTAAAATGGNHAEKLPASVVLSLKTNKENQNSAVENPDKKSCLPDAAEGPQGPLETKKRVRMNPEVKIAEETGNQTVPLNGEEKGSKMKAAPKKAAARKVEMIHVPPPEPGQPECKTQ